MHDPGPGTVSMSMQTAQLSAQFQCHSSTTLTLQSRPHFVRSPWSRFRGLYTILTMDKIYSLLTASESWVINWDQTERECIAPLMTSSYSEGYLRLMSDLRFAVSCVDSVLGNSEIYCWLNRCLFLNHFRQQPVSVLSARSQMAIITFLTLSYRAPGRHCRRQRNKLAAGHPL